MFISVKDIRIATKGLDSDTENQGVDDDVLQTFIEDGASLIFQSLSRRYIVPDGRTQKNAQAWRLLATAQKYYCLMRLEMYLELQEPAGEEGFQVANSVKYEKLYNRIMKEINDGTIVLQGLERSGSTIRYNLTPSAYTPGEDKW